MAKKKMKRRIKRNARRISFQVTPEVSNTKIAMSQNGRRNRTSQNDSTDRKKHAKKINQARGSNCWIKEFSRLRYFQATNIVFKETLKV